MNKRHAKPTTAQLTGRIYRRLLEVQANQADIGEITLDVKDELRETRDEMRSALKMLSMRLESLTDLVQILTNSHTGTFATVIDHCARLLREKETLMKMRQANDFMADAPRDFDTANATVKCYERPVASMHAFGFTGCGFKLLHRVGVRCAVCGELELPNAAQEGQNDAH